MTPKEGMEDGSKRASNSPTSAMIRENLDDDCRRGSLELIPEDRNIEAGYRISTLELIPEDSNLGGGFGEESIEFIHDDTIEIPEDSNLGNGYGDNSLQLIPEDSNLGGGYGDNSMASIPEDSNLGGGLKIITSGATDKTKNYKISPGTDSTGREGDDDVQETMRFRLISFAGNQPVEQEMVFGCRKDSDAGVMFLMGSNKEVRSKFKMNKHKIKEIVASGGEESAVATYPPDCYSLISLYGPNSIFFWFGIWVFVFQMSFLLLILNSIFDKDWRVRQMDDNPWEGGLADYIATEASPLLRGAQILSLLTFVLFADASMLDVITAVHTFPKFSLATNKDKIWCMVTSCILRLLQGLVATFVAFCLVYTSETVIDVILNFTALNFVSALDNVAFEFAKSGKYGKKMEDKVKEIEELPLPVCMFREHKHIRFWFTIVPILAIALSIIIIVVNWQEAPTRWETWQFRVEFGDDPILKDFSGCYRNDFNVTDDVLRRDFYPSNRHNSKPAKFGFCSEDRQWVLYEGDYADPCDAEALIHSARTDYFDISTVFLDNWFFGSDTPADLYFFEDDYRGLNLYCGQFLNNGVCDEDLNTPFHNYDEGDCCASTCTLPNCEVGGLENAFGSTNTSGDGYATCIDPSMVALHIHISGFISSHHPDLAIAPEGKPISEEILAEYQNEPPSDALLSLYCDKVKVLKYYINDSMENQHQTVMVNDGANCEIRIENTTSPSPKWDDPAIWFMNYTVFQGDHEGSDVAKISLVDEFSYEEGTFSFNLFPKCYLESFGNITDTAVMDPSEKEGLFWLLGSKAVDIECLNKRSMMTRYALASLNFAAPIAPSNDEDEKDISAGLWIEQDTLDLCNWRNLVCIQDFDPTQMDLLSLGISSLNLTGYIPSVLGQLSTLVRYDASNNFLTGSLPIELGDLTRLSVLDLGENYLTGSIPKEIGLLTLLHDLLLQSNQLTGSIPSEIGSLTELDDIILGNNLLDGSIPSEIGLLTSLKKIHVQGNDLIGSIPTEIGLLTNLVALNLDGNQLTGSIPSEIGLLTSLEILKVANNSLTGLIPSEVESLTSLTTLETD